MCIRDREEDEDEDGRDNNEPDWDHEGDNEDEVERGTVALSGQSQVHLLSLTAKARLTEAMQLDSPGAPPTIVAPQGVMLE